MQLELGGARQLEAELKSQLATVSAEAQNNSQEWDTSRKQLEGVPHYISMCISVFESNYGNQITISICILYFMEIMNNLQFSTIYFIFTHICIVFKIPTAVAMC